MPKFFCLSTETLRRGTLLCLRNFNVSETLVAKRGISRFFTETFLRHSADKFFKEPFSVSRTPCVEKVYG